VSLHKKRTLKIILLSCQTLSGIPARPILKLNSPTFFSSSNLETTEFVLSYDGRVYKSLKNTCLPEISFTLIIVENNLKIYFLKINKQIE